MKYKPSDLIYQPFWDKDKHDATFYCPNCKAPYYDHTQWDGDDVWNFDCVKCGKEIKVRRTETILSKYEVS
jgi:Zn ribbon nucleic-acid-binding protein